MLLNCTGWTSRTAGYGGSDTAREPEGFGEFNSDPAMPLCEGVSGAAFQIGLKVSSEVGAFEGRVELDSPGAELCGVATLPGVMIGQPLSQIGG